MFGLSFFKKKKKTEDSLEDDTEPPSFLEDDYESKTFSEDIEIVAPKSAYFQDEENEKRSVRFFEDDDEDVNFTPVYEGGVFSIEGNRGKPVYNALSEYEIGD